MEKKKTGEGEQVQGGTGRASLTTQFEQRLDLSNIMKIKLSIIFL